MILILGVVADAANHGEGGKLNVLGIFEDVNTRQLPCVVPHMALAMSLRAGHYDRGKAFDVEVPFLDPDGKMLFKIDAKLQIPNSAEVLEPVAPLALNLFNVALAKTGTHYFDIRVDGDSKGRVKLNVRLLQVADAGNANGGT